MKNRIIFSAALFAALTAGAENDFSQGVFIVNEDWYGHQNSTINYFDHQKPEGEQWQYRVFQAANPGKELGCTNQYGQIYGDRFYLIAKQEKDPGAEIVGGRITVADAKTMKVLFQSTLIDPSGKSCDGRGYLGVNSHKGYISSSNGVWVFDTDNKTVVKQIEGSGNSTGSLYTAQCGSMVRVNDYVFVAHQEKGLLVIDAETDVLLGVVDMSAVDKAAETSGAGIGSVVLARDGMLYVSVAANTSGYGETLPYLMKVNPNTLEVSVITIPSDFNAPANSWYAWTPDGFSASVAKNELFWNGGDNSWFSGKRIFKYDIDNNKFSKIIDLDVEAEEQDLGYGDSWQIYGCSMRPHPVTNELYVSLFHDFSDTSYNLRRSDDNGKLLGQYDMIKNYWFPSLPVFPDNEYPVVNEMKEQIVSASEPTTISLKDLATDADNIDAAIVKTVTGVSSSTFDAKVVKGDLVITPKENAEGKQTVDLEVNSNGHIVNTTIKLAFASSSGVEDLVTPERAAISVNGNKITILGHNGEECHIYNMSGSLVYSSVIGEEEVTIAPEINSGLYIVKVGNDVAKIIF